MPYAELLAEEFMQHYPDISVDVRGGGSSAGIRAARDKTAQIGMSSRELDDENDKERGLWREEIAIDGLAVIVHPSNPVSGLTLEQLRKIYAGEITNWRDVGGKNAKIWVVTRESGSGTRSAFEELVMNKQRISSKASVETSNGTMRDYISGSQDTIGFISLGLIEVKGQDPVKALKLDGIAATPENVQNGSYGLVRSFWFVASGEPEGIAKDFWDFAFSEEGQKILERSGLIIRLKDADEKI